MKKSSIVILILILVQLVTVLVLRFVPFGFDKPSSWGLDFNDAILTIGIYVLATISGLAISAWHHRWVAFAILWILMLALAYPILAPHSPNPVAAKARPNSHTP